MVNTFSAYGGAVNQRVEGPSQAAAAGAAAVIVRSVTSGHDNVPHTGTLFYSDSIAKIPAVSIGVLDAEFLSEFLKVHPESRIELLMDCENLPEVESYNVIGELKGSIFPDEIIVVGGHFDSWDKGDGAHDDGAPCIQTIEVLDLLNKINFKPKRTIRVVLFTNEENGARGAQKYAADAEKTGEYHLAAIESDRGAFTPRGFYVTADSLTIAKLNNWLPVLNKALIDWIRPGGSGADVSKIKNVKALLGYAPDVQRYMDLHHSDNDIFETVNAREMELGAAAITLMTLLISEEGL